MIPTFKKCRLTGICQDIGKRKAIDTKPLEEPMKQWDKLTVQEKHDLAAAMIEVVMISDETGIEVKFSI